MAGAGEYLMMLPQLLEGALEAAEVEPGDGGLDGDWLDKVQPACPDNPLQIQL